MRIVFQILFLVSLTWMYTSCRGRKQQFETIPASRSSINFKNNISISDELNGFTFANYYNGGGVSTGDINNDGFPDIYFTANSKGNNKLYLNKGNFEFEDITQKAGVAGQSDWCTGVTMADVNADGWLDIYVCAVANKLGLKGRNELFINNKNGTFAERGMEYGLGLSAYSCQAAFFDYDRDGDLDCFLLNQSDKHNAIIVDTAYRRQIDFNAGDFLLRNDVNMTGRFTDVSKDAAISQSKLGFGLGLGVADLNNDGWDDIYVGNDFHENDYYYVNSGTGNFTNGSYKHFNHFSRFSMGNDIADYNNDGHLDILTTDMLPREEQTLKTYGSDERVDNYNYKITGHGYQHQFSRNCLQHNNGNGDSFSDVALAVGVAATDWSWSALMPDLDNDGNKDIFITSGIVKRTADLDYARYRNSVTDPRSFASSNATSKVLEEIPDGASICYLFLGDGVGGFNDVSEESGLAARKGYYNGASYADFDNDGDLDLVVNSLNASALLYRNNCEKKNYLSVSFEGDSLNRFGIGAKVYLFADNSLQYQQLMVTRGFQSSVESRLHFGLGSLSQVDSLIVVWPDQSHQTLKDVELNRQLLVRKTEALSDSFDYLEVFPPAKPMFEDITQRIGIDWKHHENRFTDFNSQYLIPHQQSTRGPGLAVGDVNKDGLEDFFVGGAKDQAGILMIQTTEGKFVQSDTLVFAKTKGSEVVDAIFFDANGDGSVDLYAVTGGNELFDGNPLLSDHLYLNDGRGHFTEAPLPELLFNKSTVSVADVDRDGDADLFVGGLADARRFGYPQSSWLLINDGKASFTLASDHIINLKNIGITTTSTFTDVNGDSWMDLLVAGEWMAIQVYMNNNGVFTQSPIPKSTGLWQKLQAFDVNGDGHQDLLAGNWGHNTKLWSGKNSPLKLYIKDFDRNGSVEQIMCYTIAGKEYTFLAKDELEQALPVLKKGYLTYSEVAGKTVQFMFDDLFKDYIELKAETLSSSCFFGDGKGGFKQTELPKELQLSPLFAFASLDTGAFMGTGNFYGVLPYEGRYDAMLPTAFKYETQAGSFNSSGKIQEVNGEVRSLKWLRYKNDQKVLLIARNDDSIVFLRKTSSK